MPSSLSPQEFVAKWKKVTQNEIATSQSHFIDLCALLGLPTPTTADPIGKTYAFEMRATKSDSGHSGRADVWKKSFFAWEYKRKGSSLDSAYQQLQLYREALENPPLLVVSDISTIQVHTNFTNTVKQVYTFSLDDLLDSRRLDQLRLVFTNPEAMRKPITTAEVTETVAKEFARIAENLRRQQIAPDRAAHFLIRILFCLFAEDIGLLPASIFSKIVERSYQRPAALFANELRQLFAAMQTGGFYSLEDIPHFNGGLFDSEDVIELNNEALEILLKVAKMDWSVIEPAVLGTLFERSLDPGKRSQLGAHYTSRDDILLIVEPVLMQPLRRQWDAIQPQARALAQKRDGATGPTRARLEKELASLLTGFADEIAAVRVLDPACGSGNFLYVALKQLLDLQKAVIVLAGELGLTTFFPTVSPQQLSGIEVNEYASELAQTTIWIGYIQWLRDNGFGRPEEPILKPIKSVVKMDAILAYDSAGQPTEPVWPKADIIIGNPPFLGDKKMRSEMGNKYVEDLRKLYLGRIPGGSDLVCYWFERARSFIAAGQTSRAGLLATNSIRGGANRKVLERIKENGNIFMAWGDREWVLDGAAVRISMVGFDNGLEKLIQLNGEVVQEISPDLQGKLDITSAKRLTENLGLAFIGDTKKGQFDISGSLANTMNQSPLNPNGRPNNDVIRPWINGLDITDRPRNMYIIDFGVKMEESEAALYEQPYEYVRKNIKPFRDKVRNPLERAKWWLHARPASDLRIALKKVTRYMATSNVAKFRLFDWFSSEIIPSHSLTVIAREDDYFFGVLHSKLHELWSLRMCTWLGVGNDPRYTPTTCFETFPFPWSPGQEPAGDSRVEAIAQAARELVQKRDNWLNPPDADEAELKKRTLTNLYNQRPTWLDMAHQKLDKAVLTAYGWPTNLTDEDILERLLALNLGRSGNAPKEF